MRQYQVREGKDHTIDNLAGRSERARLGGDWAVSSILLTRKIRDVVRWDLRTM